MACRTAKFFIQSEPRSKMSKFRGKLVAPIIQSACFSSRKQKKSSLKLGYSKFSRTAISYLTYGVLLCVKIVIIPLTVSHELSRSKEDSKGGKQGHQHEGAERRADPSRAIQQ